MTRTYQISQTSSGTWRIYSNGKPLRWYYMHRDFAEGVVEELKQKARDREEKRAWRRKHGIARPPRDSKRKATYAAEKRVPMLCDGPRLTAPASQLEARCMSWAAQAGMVGYRPQVRFSNRKRGAHAWMNQIVLGTRADLGTLVHEYAHVLTWEERPAHGPKWAEVYVQLVAVAFGADLGPRMSEQLRAEFIKIGLIQRRTS